jgi:hypothetical protein
VGLSRNCTTEKPRRAVPPAWESSSLPGPATFPHSSIWTCEGDPGLISASSASHHDWCSLDWLPLSARRTALAETEESSLQVCTTWA